MRTIAFVLACVVLFLLIVAVPSFAQDHPCDITTLPTDYTLVPGELVRAGWCHSGVDGRGVAVTSWELVLPTTPPSTLALPATKVTAAPNAAGLFLWESQQVEAKLAGPYAIRAVSPNGPSLASSPITVTLGALPPPPAPFLSPVGLRLWRQ